MPHWRGSVSGGWLAGLLPAWLAGWLAASGAWLGGSRPADLPAGQTLRTTSFKSTGLAILGPQELGRAALLLLVCVGQ